MKIIILGAGVVGVTAAWYLAEAGHEVSVLERRAEPGLETSFANGGQISASHAEPWAKPSVILKMLQWLGCEGAPLLLRPRANWAQWAWGLRFLGECLPGRFGRNSRALAGLAVYSCDSLRALRTRTGIRYDELARGILHFATSEHDFDALARHAEAMRPLGIDIPVYPLKGYSVTLPLAPEIAAHAPTVSLTDEAHKLVISRLGTRLRCAGTAELTGFDTSINKRRCRAIVERLHVLFPALADAAAAEFWAGLRPATPSNVPVIGRTRFANLYLNTGHGTLGWTLAAGSGRALADLVSGRRPDVEFPFVNA